MLAGAVPRLGFRNEGAPTSRCWKPSTKEEATAARSYGRYAQRPQRG